jgi:hypothetical protein
MSISNEKLAALAQEAAEKEINQNGGTVSVLTSDLLAMVSEIHARRWWNNECERDKLMETQSALAAVSATRTKKP